MGVPNSGLLQDANATAIHSETERKVNNLDNHIAQKRGTRRKGARD